MTLQLTSIIASSVFQASYCGLGAYFIFQKHRLSYLANEMEKCQKFHLDYIEGIDKLPVDTYLVLFGTAKDANKEPVIASAKVNSFWKHFCPENIKLGKDFDLATAGTDKVTVQCQHNRKILTFGLPVGKIGQHSMRSLIHNEPVSIYGRILREGEAGRKIIPKIIIGGERNDVLMHLHQASKSFGKKLFVLIAVSFSIYFAIMMLKKRPESKDDSQVQEQEDIS